MAGRGAPRSENSVRSKDHKDKVPRKKVTAPAKLRGPSLPEGLSWHPRTVEWWDTWRKSALSATFGGTDWEFLLETALLHTAFWLGNASVAGELRLRVAKFGATPEDRMRLRLDVESPDAKPEEVPAKASTKTTAKGSERKARLTLLPDLSA